MVPARLSKPVACPKPRTRLADKHAARKVRTAGEGFFRATIWARDGWKCRICGRWVIKTLALVPNRGEVHHYRGRNVAPEDTLNPTKALLLCLECHITAQRHEVTVPKP